MTNEAPASPLFEAPAATAACEASTPRELQGMTPGISPRVAVVVKRRRVLDSPAPSQPIPGSGRPDAASTAPQGERKPRVFMVPGEQRAKVNERVDVPAPSAAATVPRSRRRANAQHRPGKVLRIASVQEERTGETNSPDGFASWLSLPEVDEYQAVCDALAAVRATLDLAAAARRLRLKASTER